MLLPKTRPELTIEELYALETELERALDQPFDVEELRRAFRRWPGPYNRIPVEARALIAGRSEASRAACLKLALVKLVLRFMGPESPLESYPDSIREEYAVHLRLVARELRHRPAAHFSLDKDLFLKDLALFDERMLPGGAQLFEARSATPRRLLVSGGLSQGIRFLKIFAPGVGTFSPFFELHTDPRRATELTPEGWDRFYNRVAEMLVRRPEIRGLFGGSWWYDPAVSGISPQLAYLYETPAAFGAARFRYKTDDDRGAALSGSPQRQAAWKSGHYAPTTYILVWPREGVLAWARNRGLRN